MRFIAHTILFFLFLLPANAAAQVMLYQRDTSIKVFAYGQQRTLAWCGGFNCPQFAMGDLNNDGLQDLVVYERGNSLRTFINMGTAGNPDYRYAPQYALNFPPISEYLTLADYNCDGIPDLFQQMSTGIYAYKGYYNAANQLCFTYYRALGNDSNGLTVYNYEGNIPAIVDVDNDGDLDILAFDDLGGIIRYYKNMRVELGQPCDSITLELDNFCWGRVVQQIGGKMMHPLNASCELLSPAPGAGATNTNSICLLDYDMDGDYDMLYATERYSTLDLLLNGRSLYGGNDSMISQDTAWQSGGVAVNLFFNPAAFNVDIDQDGKKDLLIAPNSAAENYKCIWYYKNLSTPGSPDWAFQSDTFLIDKTIDLGTAAYPALFDYDKDGLPDLIIGSDGYYTGNSPANAIGDTNKLISRISYYRNTSTPGSPSFTLQTTDLLGLDSFHFQGAAPAIGDIDNDGKADLILGHSDGTLSYFKNTAASDAVQPVWQLAALVLTDRSGDTINVGGYAAPFIYDIDKDGKNDLVIGDIDGYLQYYRNIGTTPGIINLQLINTQLGNAKVVPISPHYNYSAPFIGKIDTTGVDYLLMGSYPGIIYRFTGFQSGDTTTTYTMLDSDYSYIDTLYNTGMSQYGVGGCLRSTVTVGDIAGDGSLYMIVGDNKGGVELYKRGVYYGSNVQVPSVNVNEHGKVTVYPNPANDLLNIKWSGITQPSVQISIINMEGQQLYTTTQPGAATHAVIPVSTLSGGMYVCVLQSGVTKYYSKFTVVR